MNKRILTYSLVALGAWLFLVAEASAQISCGDVIRPGEKVKLQGNVGPCTAATGGITVIGPATLDLNGFSVTCVLQVDPKDAPQGIVLAGEKVKLKNGTVAGCQDGVFVSGAGRHKVIGVSAAFNGFTGFIVSSDRNVVKGSRAIQNRRHGFFVWGERNILKKNLSEENDDNGFHVRGSGHRIIKNEALFNRDPGFFVEYNAGEPNRILRNLASQNYYEDFESGDVDCVQNIWRGNVFSNSYPDCIQ